MSAALTIRARPLSAAAFAPFGDVLEASGQPDKVINEGLCDRFHDRARMDFGPGGRAGISIFRATSRALPYACGMLERHPEGSQAFVPMMDLAWLVIVAPDAGGRPGEPLAFLPSPGQGVNLLRNTWHGVLTPLAEPAIFAVIDRIGDTPNLEEFFLSEPVVVTS
ncbi:ureidoglycolate lyase [Pseudooceanicola sp. 216_PA32_1]|uniref:Ureidoglycolate lyase n=1 Tax=Pseudooceanicola pacificus TaxID=2676438 RepID=A0A844VZB0_9RHOB|nr:ureidoglycolate lyase [Pseudooceanicola pacificus]MWB76737.1 ureidoglycolate lyase [Pseudooceanicola pacificus]